MMQPVQSAQSRLSGEPGALTLENNTQPAITNSQLRVLSTLITQISSLTGQTENEQWTLLRQDIGLSADEPLLSRHFPGAEQHLSQRLTTAQQRFGQRQLLNQISELISKNNNRQAVSDYLNERFGRASLHSLNSNQLRQLHSLLQHDQLPRRQPLPTTAQAPGAGNQNTAPLSTLITGLRDVAKLNQTQLNQALNQLINQGNHQQLVTSYLQREFGHQTLSQLSRHQQITLLTLLLNGDLTNATPASSASHTDKPLTLSEFNTLNQLIIQLASARQQSPARIWQLILTFSDVSHPQQIPQHHFTTLIHWLLTLQHLTQQHFSEDNLSQQKPLDLQQLQQQLQRQNPPVSAEHWQQISNYAQQHWQTTPQTPLNALQAEQLLILLAQLQISQQNHQQQIRHPQPIFAPLANLLSAPFATLSSKPALAVALAVSVLLILWVLL